MWSREKPILYKEEVVFWLLEISVRGWKIFVCEGVKSRNLLEIYDKGYDKWLGEGNLGER